jgi:hypothetical protein
MSITIPPPQPLCCLPRRLGRSPSHPPLSLLPTPPPRHRRSMPPKAGGHDESTQARLCRDIAIIGSSASGMGSAILEYGSVVCCRCGGSGATRTVPMAASLPGVQNSVSGPDAWRTDVHAQAMAAASIQGAKAEALAGKSGDTRAGGGALCGGAHM